MTRNTGTRFIARNKRQRVRMKAKEYARKVMGKDRIVTQPPKISRVCRVMYEERGGVQRSTWHSTGSISRVWGSLRAEMKHRKIISIERAWAVSADQYLNTWVHLEYAQAERDALNYFYARYLMTQGTAAEGT